MTGEVEVAPWPILLRRRLAQKVGIDRRWAVLWVVLSGLFTTGFTITLLVVSLEGIAEELGTTTQVLTWANVQGVPAGPITKLADIVPALRDHVAKMGLKPGDWIIGYGYDRSNLADKAPSTVRPLPP